MLSGCLTSFAVGLGSRSISRCRSSRGARRTGTSS